MTDVSRRILSRLDGYYCQETRTLIPGGSPRCTQMLGRARTHSKYPGPGTWMLTTSAECATHRCSSSSNSSSRSSSSQQCVGAYIIKGSAIGRIDPRRAESLKVLSVRAADSLAESRHKALRDRAMVSRDSSSYFVRPIPADARTKTGLTRFFVALCLILLTVCAP
jgi:hypothetical protein